jgi:hypothetical protein
MNDNPGRRRNIPADPTAEPASDPVPTGDDVIGREENQPVRTPREEDHPAPTPRRYDESADDVVMPSDDSTLNTQI